MAVLLPLEAAVVCTAGLLLSEAGRLSIFNLFGLLLVVAVGSNYCLFFERAVPEADNLTRRRMIASLVIADLTVIGFGVLAFSAIKRLPARWPVTYCCDVLASFSRIAVDKIANQQSYVLSSFSKRRNLDRKNMQTVKQVTTKGSAAHRSLQIAVRGCDHPNVARIDRDPPTRSNSRSCKTRRSAI